MAELCIESGDVLTATADGIILPIDGTIVPRPEQIERLLGNVGRQFLRRFPDAELLEQIEAQVDLPLPLGQAVAITLEGGPFPFAILVSTLHHVEQLDAVAKRALVRTSFLSAIRSANDHKITRLATVVLQGGWRLPTTDAFSEMLSVVSNEPGPTVLVYCIDGELHAQLRTLARSVGFER